MWLFIFRETEWMHVPTLPDVYFETLLFEDHEEAVQYAVRYLSNKIKEYIKDLDHKKLPEIEKKIYDEIIDQRELYDFISRTFDDIIYPNLGYDFTIKEIDCQYSHYALK